LAQSYPKLTQTTLRQQHLMLFYCDQSWTQCGYELWPIPFSARW
jgi:hypothetical protein